MYVAGQVSAIALPLLYAVADQPELLFYLAGCMMLLVPIRLEWSHYKIRQKFTSLRMRVEETALSKPKPKATLGPGPSSAVRKSPQPSVSGSILEDDGDIGRGHPIGLPRSVSAVAVHSRARPGPLGNQNDGDETGIAGADVTDITSSAMSQSSNDSDLMNAARIGVMKARLGVDHPVSPDRRSLITQMQQSRRVHGLFDEAYSQDESKDSFSTDGKLPNLVKPASTDTLLRWLIVALYPITDNFMAVMLTVWMPVALHEQFNDNNSETATLVIACYALLGLLGQFIQSHPRWSPVTKVNSYYDHTFHAIPFLAYLLALFVYWFGVDGKSADYWFIPVQLAAFCETMGIQQK